MQKNHILGIEQYPQLLKEILAENAYVDQPFIVVLTRDVLIVPIMNMLFSP